MGGDGLGLPLTWVGTRLGGVWRLQYCNVWEQVGLEHSTKLGKAAKWLQKAKIEQNRVWKSFALVCTEILGVRAWGRGAGSTVLSTTG